MRLVFILRHLYMVGILLLAVNVSAQRTQTIKGRVADKESKAPLAGVSIGVTDLSSPLGAVTGANGEFAIDSVPVGKHTLRISYLGYQGLTLEDILVTSAKEVDLPLEMEESTVKMNEVEVKAYKDHINEMAVASVKTFDVQETERYAGSRGDPARMASNFASAQGGDDSRNDIVVRGNSPQGVLWRVEGIDIPNPNHFAVPGTTGGPVSMLNNKTLSNSDFYTGAFPAEFGDAVAGVFDLNLRNGNANRYEGTAQVGLLGTELAAEGPLKPGSGASFLVTYRYSTLSLFQGFHIKIGTTSIPNYQDGSFKVNVPLGKKGSISFFGIGGLSSINLIVSTLTEPTAQLYGESDRDQYFTSNTGFAGATLNYTINPKTFTKLTVAISGEDVVAHHDYVFRNPSFAVDSLKNILGYDFRSTTAVAHWSVNKKIGPKQTMKFGLINNWYGLNLTDSSRQYPVYRQDWQTRLACKSGTDLAQAYIQYKYRANDKLVFTAGLHAQFLFLNNSRSLEPRAGLRWAIDNNNIVTLGYGLHSQMQPLYQYFALQNGETINKGVGFTRSHHLVAGYDRQVTKTLRLKAEVYGQYLFDVPVETRAGSSFSALDQGSTFSRDFPDTLRNSGTGYNYGIELTLEKRFSHGFYYMLSGTLFDSRAKGNDGIYHSTDFNTRHVLNVLGGYEHKLGLYSTLTTGAKITWIGGKLYSPVDTAASNALGDMVVKDAQRNTLHFPDYFRADLKLGVRFNSKKVTHEIAVDLVNVFNTQNVLSLTYSSELAANGNAFPFFTQYQLGFLPIFYYRLDFGSKRK